MDATWEKDGLDRLKDKARQLARETLGFEGSDYSRGHDEMELLDRVTSAIIQAAEEGQSWRK